MLHWRGGLNLAVRMQWPTSYLGTTHHVTNTPGSTVRPRVHDAVGAGLTPIAALGLHDGARPEPQCPV
jgi:hypothetical protein